MADRARDANRQPLEVLSFFGLEDDMRVIELLPFGGWYGVVDHTRRHMEAGNDENIRRVDPVLAIKEIQDSGFEFVDYSDVLRRPEDALAYEVGNPQVSGGTDRFTLLFRKPEQARSTKPQIQE